MSPPALTTFSVVVTSHNYRTFVLDAIESALRQVPPPREVIVVDDGSTDGSADLIEERFGKSHGVCVVRQANAGQLRAFHAGVNRSSGEVVAFLDADDLWEPGYLAALQKVYSAADSPDMVFSNLRFVGARAGIWRRQETDRDCGLNSMSTWYAREYPIAPTSAISMRLPFAIRALELPAEFSPKWRTRAD